MTRFFSISQQEIKKKKRRKGWPACCKPNRETDGDQDHGWVLETLNFAFCHDPIGLWKGGGLDLEPGERWMPPGETQQREWTSFGTMGQRMASRIKVVNWVPSIEIFWIEWHKILEWDASSSNFRSAA